MSESPNPDRPYVVQFTQTDGGTWIGTSDEFASLDSAKQTADHLVVKAKRLRAF